jgi:TPR repeat protein
LATRLWDDRLAEVWAAPGSAGAGVVIGSETVVTTRHVVAGAAGGGRILARVVRRGEPAAEWSRMVVLAEDPDWDVTLLGVDRADEVTGSGLAAAAASGPVAGTRTWESPLSPSPVVVRLGTATERHCEAVGYPGSEVQNPDDDHAARVRQPEQVSGTLRPAGQSKKPVHPARQLPLQWLPLDVDGPVPKVQEGWGGMSGAGVVLADGRLAGLVTCAEAGHQRRRLYVVPLAEVLARSPEIAAALATAVGPMVVEERNAPAYREYLQEECLGPSGLPVRVGEADPGAFGVTAAGLPGEPPFLNYVPRDGDTALRDALRSAQREHRMLLVAGGSAGGKSRSAAEAARELLAGHRLLCPQPMAIAGLRKLDIGQLGQVLVWLDDAERFQPAAFKDIVRWLLRLGAVVAATVRLTELEALLPVGDLRNPLGEALTDERLVLRVNWPVLWNDQERASVGQHVSDAALLAWVAGGKSPSAWVVAGPVLETRLRHAQADDERPARYALVRSVLDWYRTGIAQPIPKATASTLMPDGLEPAEVDGALRWACESVLGVGRTTRQSLLTQTPGGDALTVHEYVLDADSRVSGRAVPDAVWTAAMDHASSDEARFAVGYAAATQGKAAMASRAWLPLASDDQSNATVNLGVLVAKSDPDQARRLFERSARAGNTDGMVKLGDLIRDNEPGMARQLLKTAAEAGNTDGMTYLAMMVEDTNPGQARRWYERAARAGHTTAMIRLGTLLQSRNPGQARRWYEEAAHAGDTSAMCMLGNLCQERDPDQARAWWQRAADAGDTDGLIGFGNLAKDDDPAQARRWYEQAAEAGNADAMYNLGKLLSDSQPDEARGWFQRAADAGESDGLVGLGTLLADEDPGQARRLFEQAAETGNATAMFNLGNLLADRDPEQAVGWMRRAANAGKVPAMFRLGRLIIDRDPTGARRWWQRAAELGDTDAMAGLGILLTGANRAQARRWFQRAADAGSAVGMTGLGNLALDRDPEQARHWWEQAAERGDAAAMFNLGNLVEDSDPHQARRWWERAAAAGYPPAMVNLGVLIADRDPEQARRWWEEAAKAGNPLAIHNLAGRPGSDQPEA